MMTRITARRVATFVAALLAFLMAGYVEGVPAQAAAYQTAYPTYLTVSRSGAAVTTSTVQADGEPSDLGVLAGKSVSFVGGLMNDSGTAQTVTVHFSIECADAAYHTIDKSTSSIKVTVPGDPATIKGFATLKKVTGTFTVPSTCVHHYTPDGYFAFTADFGTMSAAQVVLTTIGSKLAGPGLPAAGAAGTIVLYRAIDSQEFDYLAANGNKFAMAKGQIGKYFYPTKAQAEALASKYEAAGYGDYVVTKTTIADSALATGADSISIAGEGEGYFLLESAVAVLTEAELL